MTPGTGGNPDHGPVSRDRGESPQTRLVIAPIACGTGMVSGKTPIPAAPMPVTAGRTGNTRMPPLLEAGMQQR